MQRPVNKKMKRKRNPLISGILNFILPGAGYLYIGKRKTFAYLILCGLIISMADMFYYNWLPPDTFSGWISTLVILFAFGYDAYEQTK